MPKLYFATDIHGSELCWKKFLAAAAFYKVEIVILGGDISGKAIVPLVVTGSHAVGSLLGSKYELEGEEAMVDFERNVSSRGYYPVRMSPEERDELSKDSRQLDARFMKELLSTVERWIGLAEERLPEGVRCFVCPGNDDPVEVDELFAKSSRIEIAEGRRIELAKGFSMVSTGWSNATPWHTYREEDETALGRRIAAALGAQSSRDQLIFNFHCPPYASGLDDAPELGEDFSLKNAGQSTVPVGSRAVRAAIEESRPLLSLHGHIHEAKGIARIKKTLCVNPGSLYEQGVLQGALFDLDERRGIRSYALTTG
jgi:Icc-related predicted phosphoesterase